MAAIPMAKLFVVSAPVLRTSLRVSMGMEVVGPDHPHSCGSHGGFAGAIGGNARHIKSCSSLGRGIRAHGAVESTVVQMVHQFGLSAEVAETEQYIRVGVTEWKSGIFVQNGQESLALGVKIINIDCGTYQRNNTLR